MYLYRPVLCYNELSKSVRCNEERRPRAHKGRCMQVAECNTNRLKMMAEAADSSMAIKVLVVKVPHPVLHCTAVPCIHH